MVKKAFKFIVGLSFVFGCAVKTPAPVKAEKPKSSPVFTDSDAKPTDSASANNPVSQSIDLGTNIGSLPGTGDNRNPIVSPAPVTTPSYNSSDIKGVARIGLIFSGGGAKTWAHIGVLKEIEKAKWPIRAVAGFEWGAAVAAVYANKLSANEVEWELSKVKEFDEPEKTAQTLFNNRSVNDLKVPFVCASLNISKQETYLLNRGQLSQLLPFCVAHPPLSKPYKQSIAEMNHISALAGHLRATGVKKVILINVLSQNTKRSFTSDYLSLENILWVKSAAEAAKKQQGVDDVIQINLDDYGITDLDQRREIIAKGAELGYNQVKKITQKYGL